MVAGLIAHLWGRSDRNATSVPASLLPGQQPRLIEAKSLVALRIRLLRGESENRVNFVWGSRLLVFCALSARLVAPSRVANHISDLDSRPGGVADHRTESNGFRCPDDWHTGCNGSKPAVMTGPRLSDSVPIKSSITDQESDMLWNPVRAVCLSLTIGLLSLVVGCGESPSGASLDELAAAVDLETTEPAEKPDAAATETEVLTQKVAISDVLDLEKDTLKFGFIKLT